MRHLFFSACALALFLPACFAQAIQARLPQESSRNGAATGGLDAAIPTDTQFTRGREVEFGVNGHSLSAPSYYNVSLERQISLLRRLRLKTYLVNINPSHTDKFDRLDQLITLAQQHGIRVLPVVVFPPKNYSDETSAYNDAKAAMYNFATQFDTRIPVWELGNEYDLYCVKPGASGASPADYETARYLVVRGLIKGMLAGLREASPSALSIVQTSQHTTTFLDSGFLERLMQDGITFDITGYHYYSKDGHVPRTVDGTTALKVLHDKFHKPIWITEFDKSASSPTVGPSSDPKEQGVALTAALNEISAEADKYDVIGADIYELLNQPELLNVPGVNPCQAQFGIVDANGHLTDASRAVQEFLRAY